MAHLENSFRKLSMRQVTKKTCSPVLYSCILHRKCRQPRGVARKTIGECDLDVRTSSHSAWDSAQPILSDENLGDRANLWIILPCPVP